jgi:Mg-chelatase subunit ChlD
MVSIVPTFTAKEPQEEIYFTENERPEEEDLILPSEKGVKTLFIFLVDRSGSMNGRKMEMTKEALNLFLQSLPPESLF